MIKLTSIAAVLFLTFIGVAHAATLDLDFTLGNATPTTGGTYTPNINLQNPAPVTLNLTGDAHVLPGFTIPNFFVRPTGSLFDNRFLAVLHNPGSPGTATFDLTGANANSFAFTWGTIDSYNSLIIKDATHTFTIAGDTDILNHLTGSIPGTTQANVEFYDPFGSILSVELLSGQNSFEVANFYAGFETPLPPAMLLFGSAVLALFFVSYRRRTSTTI